MKLIMLALLFIFVPGAHGDVLKENGYACVTEELLNELTMSAVNEDNAGYLYLLSNGCIIAKQDFPVSILHRSFSGLVKIRAYAGDNAFVLWTYKEDINEN